MVMIMTLRDSLDDWHRSPDRGVTDKLKDSQGWKNKAEDVYSIVEKVDT
jgi:hypothetical protein